MKYIIILLTIFLSKFSFSQTITESEKDSIIIGIKKAVTENYIITNKAKLISDSLLTSNYSNITTADSFEKKLNADLYKLSHDKHLFLQYRPEVAVNLTKHKDIYAKQNKKEKKEHYGFEKPKIFEGNVGYLKIKYFADASKGEKTVLKYMRSYKNTSALIIDLRGNLGGSGSMLQLLTGIFLIENETDILKINYKSRTTTLKSKPLDSSKKYLNRPIYILCDSETYSAGEAFTLIMKNRGRAIIIGDTTGGAGNVAGPHAINSKFVLTIPVGIVVDPATNIGWEQTGVIPQINANSKEALNVAIEMIKTKK